MKRLLTAGLLRAKFNLQYGWRRRYKVTISGVTTRFTTEDPYSLRWFYPRYGGKSFHEEAVSRHLVDLCRDKTCFVDVGANLGWFTCVVGNQMKTGEVHSFEIDDVNYGILSENVRLNGLRNVHTTLAAVGDKKGFVDYFRPPRSASPETGITKNKGSFSERIAREMIDLDSYFEAAGVAPDVLKIDVEGAEKLVLDGMQNIMKMYKPVVILEVHPMALRTLGHSVCDIVDLLNTFGYDVLQVRNHRGSHSTLETKKFLCSEINKNSVLYAK